MPTMRSTGRRRLDMVVLGLGGLAVAGITTIGGLFGDGERVSGMWVGASLHDSGAADITEVIDYDFGPAQERHGIFRTIPGLTTESPVLVESATAPDGIAAQTPELIDGERGIRLKIGHPNITINGRHRYRLDYTLPTVAGGGHLAWDAVGTGWDVPIRQTEVHVVAPWTFIGLTCSAGRTGAAGGCALAQPTPGHLVATFDELESGEGITIQADRGSPLTAAPTLPAPPIDAPPDPGAGLAKPAGLAALTAVGASGVSSALVRRRGRERVGGGGATEAAWAGGGGPTGEMLVDRAELASMATTDFAPPEGITAAQGGIILSESVRAEHKVAWLLDAAIVLAVELIEVNDGTSVRLVRRSDGPPEIARILDAAFAGRSEISLGSYDKKFAKAWAKLDKTLRSWEQHSDLWDQVADRRKTRIRFVGALGVLVGAAGAFLGGILASGSGGAWLSLVAVGAAITGAGLAAAVRGWELRVRTPAGSGLYLRVESFRRFLAGSEAFHAEEAAKRGLLREYTAWAVAVGEIDRWERAVGASSAIPQDAGLGYVHLAPLLISSTSSASTAPSSSGSGGGGGGGSVGGGGGGGGGGSW